MSHHRSQSPRHRRLQGRAGDRSVRQAGRHRQGGRHALTLESDKATMDVPSPAAGTVKEVKVKIGDKVSEGTLIVMLDSAAAAPPHPSGERRGCAERTASSPAAAAARRFAWRGPSGGRDDDDHRGESSRHRRLQGRAGDRDLREARRCREARGPAGHARIRQGDDGRPGAVRRRGRRHSVAVGTV